MKGWSSKTLCLTWILICYLMSSPQSSQKERLCHKIFLTFGKCIEANMFMYLPVKGLGKQKLKRYIIRVTKKWNTYSKVLQLWKQK